MPRSTAAATWPDAPQDHDHAAAAAYRSVLASDAQAARPVADVQRASTVSHRVGASDRTDENAEIPVPAGGRASRVMLR